MLASLRDQTTVPNEIIVVDNGSTDGTRSYLEEQDHVRLIANAGNLGFAAANNQGIRSSTGELVLLVNTDVELAADYIERCAEHFQQRDIGSVTGKLRRARPPEMIDSTGHAVYRIGWTENRGEMLKDAGYDQPGEVFGVCAAAALYRRAALESVALEEEYLDETFFSYVEDVDLDWRLRWAGWHAWYEPAAVAVHHRHASGARHSPAMMRHILKNRVLTVAKNYDRRSLLANLPGVAMFTVVKTADFTRTHPTAALGLVDAVRLMPTALRRRRTIQGWRRVSPAQVRRWLLPFPWVDRIRRRLS